ncbi:MAG TPA: hypothetical protein GXX25_02205, partial [Desulfotomaculum sp.]|nr:hypothetical protein [Desulfotomaculum sp.]
MPDSVKRIAAEEATYGHREAVFEHYVRRTVRAIETEDVNALARAVPGHLLEIETEKAVAVLNSAVKMITTNARQWV